eukprot:CAMPEP_0168765438 /NCGR_PEP_ID=MMETSP0725-20121227/324_1 /TAXON_ID=265536 /ORGANISM="Amphiprora sp., Strain CCMP467" /LENGTH=616 /DNA_ID=CAMNT_0008814691 /DNA_START=1 /DNA_END=1851 /DNA_ORIENTATION=+
MQPTHRKPQQQATRKLRRKRGTKGGGSLGSGLYTLIAVIVGFTLLAVLGLLLELGRSDDVQEHPRWANVQEKVRQLAPQSLLRKGAAAASSAQHEPNTPPTTTAAQKDEEDEPQNPDPVQGNDGATASTNIQQLPHLKDPVPLLPIFSDIPNAPQLVDDLLQHHKPTMAGIVSLMQTFVAKLHEANVAFGAKYQHGAGHGMEIIQTFFDLAKQYLGSFDAAYRGQSIFPVREDGSIYLSLAAYREHLLAETMVYAFTAAKHPEKLFIGAVVQNCFGKVYPNGTIDASGTPCKTGVQVVGKTANGQPQTKISDAPIDTNGIQEFCAKPDFQKYCDNGQVRVLYVHETESLGPAMARYYASKLWGGETYFMQCDSHLLFAKHWDEKYRQEIEITSNYPKSVLSSYPPGFSEQNHAIRESSGARLCSCDTLPQDPNPIVRINTGIGYRGNEPRPTQIPYIAAGFFFARAEFLTDWPFDPYMPWLFMGEEIALSMRAWTNGWNIYAPRKNLIAHQYRPGRLGLPKFWETASRVYKGPGMNNILQHKVIKRTKHMVGYPDSSLDKIQQEGIEVVLTDIEHYGLGKERTWQEYLDFAFMSIDEEHDIIVCHRNSWCNKGERD